VRNPYRRFLSMYTFFRKRRQVESIEGYFPFAEPPIAQELAHVPMGCVPIRVDRIIRVETLLDDVNALPFVKEPVQIPHERQSNASSLPMTNQIIEFVNNFYRADFEAFGYPFDERLDAARGAVSN